ncbi:MAG: alpha/beta fold hydrolase [Oenococcus sp.]|uniref:alpha/beta hydrolase n=1 Tax=Oenococcus sp. TaxID=1979414 RepID=UPI0039E9422F
MDYISVNFFSQSLKMKTTFNVCLPSKITRELSPIILLHGMGDDENSWLQNSLLPQYLAKKQLALIMPRADLSYYQDTPFGNNYFNYVSMELLQKCRQLFPLQKDRQYTYIAGISMGGYGALKVALNHPDSFAKCYALSPNVDLLKSWRTHPDRDAWFSALFDSPELFSRSSNDLFSLVSHWDDAAPKPAIYIACGQADPFYDDCLRFYKNFKKQHFPGSQDISSPQGHNWIFWNEQLKKVFEDAASLSL